MRRLPLALLPILVTAAALAPAAHAGGPALTIGAVDDAFKQPTLVAAKARMDLARAAGFEGIRMTVGWQRDQVQPDPTELAQIRNAVTAAGLDGITVYLSISFGSRNAPIADEYRLQFAQFAATLANDLPTVRYYTIGNEPNLNRFWLPQFGPNGEDVAAAGYEQLLAQAYDALKGVSPKIVVIGGAVSPRGGDDPHSIRLTHSPTTFIPDLGDAYRKSGRLLPIMDWFAFHPYEETSSTPPTTTHANTTTVALADYGKLVALLGRAFDGTAQPGSTIPIVYNEFGVESQIPPAEAALYTGTEPATTKPVPEDVQGAYYRQAVELAFCQPTVRGIFLFQVFDEPRLLGWQSGVYYADAKPKASLPIVRAAISASRRGVVTRCAGLKLPVGARIAVLAPRGRRLRLRLACTLDCVFTLRVERIRDGRLVHAFGGTAVGGIPKIVTLPPRRLPRGTYRYRATVTATLNPGPPRTVASVPFTLR